MRKKVVIIGLQVVALVGFIFMALGSSSSTPVLKSKQVTRLDRGACGDADYVFMGQYDNQSACSQACHKAGFTFSCLTGDNCFCK